MVFHAHPPFVEFSVEREYMASQNTLQDLLKIKISRRGFLRDMSAMVAGAAASSALPLNIARAGEQTAPAQQESIPGVSFTPLSPDSSDEFVTSEGFSYQVIIKRGDVFTPDGKTFGDNNDYIGWFPFENNADEGLLIVNNEYVNPYLLYGYESIEEGGETPKTPEQILLEKEHVGISIVHIRRVDGKWEVVADSDYAKRWDATGPMIPLTGPVAGADSVQGATEVVGTFGNCAGGYTPWGTSFSCEEDYYAGYGEDSINEVDLEDTFRWTDDPETAQPPEHYGWAIEIDPFTGSARKHTALGRFIHEAIAIGIGSSGKAVIYMTDDDDDRCIYKFISANNYDPDNREANLSLFEEGTLYVANFEYGEWIPLVWEGNEEVLGDPEETDGYELTSQADVLTYTYQAAIALGGTPTDAPEGIAIHPRTGHIFIAFSGNSDHGNIHGHITDIAETDGDHESLTFEWDIFAVGGKRAGFSGPDNIRFDQQGNLWMVTDVSADELNTGVYAFMGHNSLFMFPTEGENFGKGFRLGSGPAGSELTGPIWMDANTLLLSVQHPGENTLPGDAWTSHWPEGGDSVPRSAVIAITGPFPAASV
jgi:uncharacterized protein